MKRSPLNIVASLLASLLAAPFFAPASAVAGAKAPFVAVPANHANLPNIVVDDNMVFYPPVLGGTPANLSWSGDVTNLNDYGLYKIFGGYPSGLIYQEFPAWSAVRYLSDAVFQMTGQRLPVVSNHTYPLNNSIMLTTLDALKNSPGAPADVVSAATAALGVGSLYDRREAFYIRTEASGIYIVANQVSGLGHAVVELLEGDHAATGYQVGYETLSMGPNWTYVPDFSTRNLAFNTEFSDRPDYYFRSLSFEGGQSDILNFILRANGFTNGMPAPDETEDLSYEHWQRGFRVANIGSPREQSMSGPPSQTLQGYNVAIASNMIATGDTRGFLAPAQLGLYASRPAPTAANEWLLWFATDVAATATNAVSWCVLDTPASGTTPATYKWFETSLAGVRPHADLSVPAVRNILLADMKTRAENYWKTSPGRIFGMNTEPADGGPNDAQFVQNTANPNWYPQYRQAEGQAWGPYALSGSPVGPVPNQATETWWWNPTNPDSANAYSDTLMAFNNWILREYDKYIDSLPPANQTSGGINKKSLVTALSLSYYVHDVPPNFNLDPRVRVSDAIFPAHRGQGKWKHCISHEDVTKAFSTLSPQPGSSYALLSQSLYTDWGVGNAADRRGSASDIQAYISRDYQAGGRGIAGQGDINFGKMALHYYMLSKMFWNATLTVDQLDALRARWITRAFGANAAGVMKKYYDLMLPENYMNTPSGRGLAISYIQQADALVAPGSDEQRRLDDLKQFWYAYYLQDIGATASSPELKEFMWKGQMSYMYPLFTFQTKVFGIAGFDAAERAAGTNYFNAATHFMSPAHYEPAETAGWWANVVAHWPVSQVDSFADAVLANGEAGFSVDVNNLTGVQEFRDNSIPEGYLLYANTQLPKPLSRANRAGETIGFQVCWSDTTSEAYRLPYGISKWDTTLKQWTSVWSGTADSVSTTGPAFVTSTNPQGQCRRIIAAYTAPSAGLYRFDVGSISYAFSPTPIGLINIRLATLDYDLASNTYSGASVSQGLSCSRYADTGPAPSYAYFYIPKGTASLDMEVWSAMAAKIIELHTGLPGTGNWTRTRDVDVTALGTHRIPLNPGEDGSVAGIKQAIFQIPYFYSIPMVWATSPSLLMVPKDIAVADGLTPYTGAPIISAQPRSQTAAVGQAMTFGVTAIGEAPLSYQWRRNGANISGATAASYTTPATTVNDNGAVYSVVVTNAGGSTTSTNAVLTEIIPPAITVQPADQTVPWRTTATFSVTANGTAPLSYQWRKNGTNIAGATAASYTTPLPVTISGETYSVVVTNASGSATSDSATLSIAPAFNLQPASIMVTASSTAAFAVSAYGAGTLSYQWYKGGAAIAGATSAYYTTPATALGDNGAVYTVVVTNAFGSATSVAATLSVTSTNTAPSITVQPAAQSATVGAGALFRVTAVGTWPLRYQWRKNGVDISGATAVTYTTPATTAADDGNTYSVVVTNMAGSATSNPATLAVNTRPSIVTQPAARTVTAGQTATFSVAANGTAPLNYQWRKNGANIAGATAASYTTPATALADNGTAYSVVITNAAGSVTSSSVALTVSQAPAITAQPSAATVSEGQTATFRVTANGTSPLGYQWRKGGANIAGATAASYTTPATAIGDSGAQYSVVITNAVGSATSANGILTVRPVAPAITIQPANHTVVAGNQTATFNVAAQGTAPLGYQWRKNGANIAGATSASYTTPVAAYADNGTTYSVVVTNAGGSATSTDATLTVKTAPIITAQPASTSATEGLAATFSVTATGTTPLSYQWTKNGTAIAGATAASYTTPATVMGDSGAAYAVTVANNYGSVTSAAAILTVNQKPVITVQPVSQTVIAGQTATFSVTATGVGTLTYQWRKNGADIAGATAATYTTPVTVAGDNGANYSVVISNMTTSANAALRVWGVYESAGVGVHGTTSLINGVYSISASGLGIGGTSDSFYFDYLSMTGNNQIIARVVSLQNTSAGTKAGVMMRASLTDNSTRAFAGLTPGVSMFSRRVAPGGATVADSGATAAAPYWVKLVRYGNSISGFSSADGISWTFLGTEIFPNLPATLYVGMALSSGNNSSLATATFDHVTLGASPADGMPTVTLTSPQTGTTNEAPASATLTANATADPGGQIIQTAFYQDGILAALDQSAPFTVVRDSLAAGAHIFKVRATDDLGATVESAPITVTVTPDSGGALPAGWTMQDVGTVAIPGTASYSGSDGKFTIGSSSYAVGVGGTNDNFSFAWKSWYGNCQVVARVTSRQGYGTAGVMIRNGLATNACTALMGVHSALAEYDQRINAGDALTAVTGGSWVAPYWVKVVRYGNSLTGYRSADGTNWVFVGTGVMTLPGTMNVGLALTSGGASTLYTATFDNVSIAAPPANILPTVSLSSPQTGTANTAPASVTLNAAAADSDGTVQRVSFYQDGALKAADGAAPYTVTLANVGAGTHAYVAQVTDDKGATVSSTAIQVIVSP